MGAPEWRLLAEKIRRLALPKGREALGSFSLEGYRSVERALANGAALEELLISERLAHSERGRDLKLKRRASEAAVPIRVAPDSILEALCDGRGLGETFAVCRIPERAPFEDLFRPHTLILLGWNLADPGNTGALIRSALASGASAFLAVGTTDPWHPKAVRTSMGSCFALPIYRMSEEAFSPSSFQEAGWQLAASVCREGIELPVFKRSTAPLILLMGSEAFGLPEELARQCDHQLRIPMPEGVDSFSVNAAAAVFCYALLHGNGRA